MRELLYYPVVVIILIVGFVRRVKPKRGKMNKELWIALLSFAAGVIVLAGQVLPVPQDLSPWLAFAAAVINLALGTFFGVTGVRANRAARAAKAAK